jgi:hypothetical protein
MTALRASIDSFNRLPETNKDRMEMTMLLNKLISMVDQTKIDLKMSRWIHMPKDSEEYEYNKFLCGSCEAYAYNNLGAKSQLDSSEEVSQLGIKS